MALDPDRPGSGGRYREVQNWIGGSLHSPRDAAYIPPPPETVESYLDDLLVFANRTDMPALVQAAIAHAQFESIHPFSDGNGRIGRALTQAILRSREATSDTTVPISAALLARRRHYYGALDAYRTGDLSPILRVFTRATTVAASESQSTALRLVGIEQKMRDEAGPVRRGSAVDKILDLLSQGALISAHTAQTRSGSSSTAVHDALERLQSTGTIRSLGDRKRDQVWGATIPVGELDDLGWRIGRFAG